MQFGKSQKIKFKSDNGTYSIVTPRENQDSQITATGEEAQLFISFFGRENIQLGNVGSNPEKARKTFRLYPGGKVAHLNLVFPKSKKTELRLYISERAGFKPGGLEIWFMFIKEGELWIGSMQEGTWRSENQLLVYDEHEDKYQDGLQALDQIKIDKLKAKDSYSRDRRKAISRMELSDYKCEFDNNHELFVSRSTQRPYLEAHHLIPMSLQKDTDVVLDTLENIYSLCPNCHRAIHHAEKNHTQAIIDDLVGKRPKVLSILDNEIIDIYNFYAVESIA